MSQKARILIVEDNELIAMGTQRMLKKLGYHVTSIISSGEHAVEQVEQDHPDLVLMDIKLPSHMDGIDTAKHIQTHYDIPIIYLTAHLEDKLLTRAKTTKPYGYLLKPFREEELRTTIEMALYKHKMDKELQEANQRLEQEIIERKRTEEELKKAKEMALEAKDVAEKAQQAAEEARRAAEAANNAKSEFLANMSHELRTPLNGILGYAQILKRDPELTENQRDSIEIIQRSGEHLLTLLNDILDLSKIEAGKLELEPIAFNLLESLKALVEMTRFRAYQKNLSFIYEEDTALPHTVKGDEKCLRQVLLNLLGNAVKFTEQGRVALRVTSCELQVPESESGIQCSQPAPHTSHLASRIRFEVEDTGIGIPPKQIERIFSPFEQVKDRHLYPEGTGLGLAISQRLVRMMGSELHVKSIVGQGSTFWFDVELPEVNKVMTRKAKPSRRIVGFKGTPKKILIVDDKEANRVVLKDMLFPVGFEIIEATGGQEAIDKAQESRPDLILMDLVMPNIDGFEATRQIRKLETGYSMLDTGYSILDTSTQRPAPSAQHSVSSDQRPVSSTQHPVIIAVSASVFEQTQQESLNAGCEDFIAKPVSEQRLFDKLQAHLNLEWIYDEILDKGSSQSAIHKGTPLANDPIIPPPQEELSRLKELTLIGDIMGIHGLIQEIEALDPKFKPFAAKTRELAKSLKISKIQQFIEQYIEEKP